MKKIFLLLSILILSTVASAQYTYQIVLRNAAAPDSSTSANIIGSGAAFHNLTWNVSGTVATCSVRVDGSADGITWGTGDVIGATNCATNGNVLSSSHIVNYVRINLVTFTGTAPVFTANVSGYITQPSGGGTVTSITCGTGTTCSPSNPITGSGTITASGSVTTMAAPAAPTLANQNASGARSITYAVVARVDPSTTASVTHTEAGSTATIANANASPQVLLSLYKVAQARCYDIWVTADSGARTLGKVANCVGYEYLDTGGNGDAGTLPATNTTQLYPSPLGCNIPVGASTLGDAMPCTPNEKDDFFFETATSGTVIDPRWSWLNQTFNSQSSSVALTGGDLVFTGASSNNAFKFTGVCQAIPSAPYTITSRFWQSILAINGNHHWAQLVVTDGTAKAEGFELHYPASTTLDFVTWTGALDTYGNTAGFATVLYVPQYGQIKDDNTNLTVSVSVDGLNWTLLHTEAHTAFLTATKYCVGASAAQSTAVALGNYKYVKVTTP